MAARLALHNKGKSGAVGSLGALLADSNAFLDTAGDSADKADSKDDRILINDDDSSPWTSLDAADVEVTDSPGKKARHVSEMAWLGSSRKTTTPTPPNGHGTGPGKGDWVDFEASDDDDDDDDGGDLEGEDVPIRLSVAPLAPSPGKDAKQPAFSGKVSELFSTDTTESSEGESSEEDREGLKVAGREAKA